MSWPTPSGIMPAANTAARNAARAAAPGITTNAVARGWLTIAARTSRITTSGLHSLLEIRQEQVYGLHRTTLRNFSRRRIGRPGAAASGNYPRRVFSPPRFSPEKSPEVQAGQA